MLNMPPAMPAIFAGLLFTVLLICGIAEFRRAPRGRLLLYFVLRMGAFLLLALILTSSGTLRWERTRIPLEVILLRDVSDSMRIQQESVRREFQAVHDETLRALNAVPGIRITELVFAAETAPARKSRVLPGGSTALGDALASLARRYAGARIFLLSDGRSNSGVHPAAAAAFLKSQGAVLNVLLPGRTGEEQYPSIVFESAAAPDSFRSGQPPLFRAMLLLSGIPEGKSGTLHAELRIDGKPAGEIRRNADSPDVELRFNPDAAVLPASGWHEFEIRAELRVPDAAPLRTVFRDVFEVPAENAAMLLWNRMDPELSALLHLLRERYRPFHFAYASVFAGESAKEQEKRIDSLRLLMLGPVLPDALSAGIRKRIAARLHSGTLTLLFLSPRVLNAWSRDPEIGRYVPAAAAAFTRLPDGTRYRFTDSGRMHSLPFASLWRMTPKPSAAAKRLPGDWNGLPPLVLSTGNVSAFAPAGTWRWRLSPDRSRALAYTPFWTQMLGSCDNFDGSDLHFSIVRADTLLSSDLYRFTVEDYGRKTSGTELRLLRRDTGTGTMRKLLSFGPAENRVSSALLRITEPGVHWFQAEDAKSNRRTKPVPLVVRGNEKEQRFSTPDTEMLRMLAELGGGSALGRAAVRSAAEKLAELAEKPAYVHSRQYQEPPAGFRMLCALLAFLLLAAEWLLRKKESCHAGS